MTRREPTPEELATGAALLRSIDDGVFEISDFTYADRPDLTLRANGHAQGYEIAGLLPEHIHQNISQYSMWLYRKGVKTCKISVPIEPHMWIKNVIEKKWERAQKFPKTEFTRDLTLLVHRPLIGSELIDYDEDGFLCALDLGAACATHGFAGIGYWSGKRFVRLNPSGDKVDHKLLKWKNLGQEYDAYIQIVHTGTNLCGNMEGRSFSFSDVPAKYTKDLKPMSPQLQGLTPKYPSDDYRYSLDFNNNAR